MPKSSCNNIANEALGDFPRRGQGFKPHVFHCQRAKQGAIMSKGKSRPLVMGAETELALSGRISGKPVP